MKPIERIHAASPEIRQLVISQIRSWGDVIMQNTKNLNADEMQAWGNDSVKMVKVYEALADIVASTLD